MKRISLTTLASRHPSEDYEKLYTRILKAMEDGTLKPVKASGKNGKKPALYQEYWVLEEKKDYSLIEEELKYHLVPQISTDYYLGHLPEYEKDRLFVQQLNGFLQNNETALREPASVNERSYEIWHREKFLKREQGRKILKRCGINPASLNYYETSEPFAYYSHNRETPQNLLILENKDTFYSMRRHLLSGRNTVCGTKIDTLIYGAGKGILRSFLDFEVSAEPYMAHPGNTFYYFGDLDYEGIGIFENLAELMKDMHEIIPFIPAYETMLKKALPETGTVSLETKTADKSICEKALPKVYDLPRTKEGQNENLTGSFFSFFEEKHIQQMQHILTSGFYIPQEILNGKDF